MKQMRELFDQMRDYFKDYPQWVPEVVIGLFFGLIIGFLVRLLGKYFVLTATALLVSVLVLYYGGFVTFHTQQTLAFFGWAKTPSMHELVTSFLNGIKDSLVTWAVGIIGFIIGWKLGG